jgi:hypothetical protein
MIHDKFRNMFDNRDRAAYLQEREQYKADKTDRRFDPKNSAKGPVNQFGYSPDSEKKIMAR